VGSVKNISSKMVSDLLKMLTVPIGSYLKAFGGYDTSLIDINVAVASN
jgi:hypothetical protein